MQGSIPAALQFWRPACLYNKGTVCSQADCQAVSQLCSQLHMSFAACHAGRVTMLAAVYSQATPFCLETHPSSCLLSSSVPDIIGQVNATLLPQVRLEMDTPTGRRVRAHKAKGLTDHGADKSMFNNEAEGRTMSVAEYFEKAYGLRCHLAAPLQPSFLHAVCSIALLACMPL